MVQPICRFVEILTKHRKPQSQLLQQQRQQLVQRLLKLQHLQKGMDFQIVSAVSLVKKMDVFLKILNISSTKTTTTITTTSVSTTTSTTTLEVTTPEWPVIDFNCEPVLRVTKIGQFPEHQDLRGSYKIVMSAGGVPDLIYGSLALKNFCLRKQFLFKNSLL